MNLIDLRSDTVTKPDAEMRRAMAEAEVGDDGFGEDPTVNRLEEEAAEVVGMEAALFVPSGTMGNQIALHLHGRPGGEVICDAACHIVNFEIGGMAALSGLLPRTLPSANGLLDPAAVEAAFRRHARYLSDSVPVPDRRVIALDGKTLRHSFDHLNDRAAAHVLSAFASDAALILAHHEIPAAADEIAAAQSLIDDLGVQGVLFTADALHGQKNLRRRRAHRQRPVGPHQGQPAHLA